MGGKDLMDKSIKKGAEREEDVSGLWQDQPTDRHNFGSRRQLHIKHQNCRCNFHYMCGKETTLCHSGSMK